MIYLNFIWHMHQPYYKDDIANQTFMPWVFLHAIKDYYDMPYLLSRYEGLRATFNLVPSLVVQLESYANRSANDVLLETIKLDVHTLTQEDKVLLNRYLFAANEENLIKPLWRYHELYLRYKHTQTLEIFDFQDIVDTQVLFLLSWCGNYLRSENKLVKTLIAQGANFSQEQKRFLLDELCLFCGEIVGFYNELQKSGVVEIATTPFYHPILPLLIDPKVAKEANGYTVLPDITGGFGEFAEEMIQDSFEFLSQKISTRPKGFWPAEGAISEDALALFAKNQVAWVGSDEDILSISSHVKDKNKRYIHAKTGIELFFRDKYLSDLIGFEYSKMDGLHAANDFITQLKKKAFGYDDVLIHVILDGENAWEFYPHNAKDFFENLYNLLLINKHEITTLLPSMLDGTNLSKIELHHISPGSWIRGNFDIWIGKPQKNKAWEMLFEAYQLYESNKQTLSMAVEKAVHKELMIAMGSDWFWWYDDDHFSMFKDEFDAMFQARIQNIYTLMGLEYKQKVSMCAAASNDSLSASLYGAMHKGDIAKDADSMFRYCKLKKNWILFAPKRAKRPYNFMQPLPHETTSVCPFDAGNEGLTPLAIDTIEKNGAWSMRVIPNLYNVLSIEIEPEGKRDAFFDVLSGFGAHEVIVETPKHNHLIFDYTYEEFVDYLTIIRRRFESLQKDKRLSYVSLFKNSGQLAGASMAHSHSQIIALPFVPKDMLEELKYKKEYFNIYKRALLDDLVYEEKQYQKNIIFENRSFICYAPYASAFAYQTKIVAKDEIAVIGEFSYNQISDLAEILGTIFRSYKMVLGQMAFNMIFKNHPYETYLNDAKEYFRFCIDIYPRLAGVAGFELDSGLFLNSILPEETARQLRKVIL